MTPLRFCLPCDPLCRGAAAAEEIGKPRSSASVCIRQLQTVADRRAVRILVDRCRASDPTIAGRFRPAGIAAELTSRAGRKVHAWLAWRAAEVAGSAEQCPLGMLSLVEAGLGPQCRSSVAWLLVHPEARRQGIATALVRRAAAHVSRRGGREFFAETLSSWPAAAAFWMGLAADGSG